MRNEKLPVVASSKLALGSTLLGKLIAERVAALANPAAEVPAGWAGSSAPAGTLWFDELYGWSPEAVRFAKAWMA